jgi:hypothetical protein
VASEADRPRVVAGHGRRLLAAGAVEEGFETIARWLLPGPAAGVDVRIAAGPWRPGQPVEGRLLVVGEEELADEILFASVLPALAADVPDLILAIDPQWRRLAERSFPGVLVVPQLRRVRCGRRQLTAELDSPHVHADGLVGAWASLRSLLAAYRPPQTASGAPYLQPDPRRIGQWKAWLLGLGSGPKVGVRWRAADADHRVWRQTPPLTVLRDALAQPGLCVVPLQEIDGAGDLAALEAAGVVVRRPPGLNRSDLSDLAALCCALDLVVGAPDAVTHLAAACGAETCLLAPPRHWALLGEDTYPWFPKARVIASPSFNDWAPAMTALYGTLAAAA